jgi:pSer/pThr/pTyr-binding forkhead associated (FHA) protein
MGGVVATLTVRKSLELASNTVFELQSREYRIGRSQSPEFHNDLVIPDSPVSRVHATLTYQNGAFVLRDADSKFGCKVNGVPVGPQGVTLNDGDEVMLGTQTVLDYRRLAPAASEELTEDVNDLDSTADAQDADGTQEAGRDPERTA